MQSGGEDGYYDDKRGKRWQGWVSHGNGGGSDEDLVVSHDEGMDEAPKMQ
jgi:hypothetical protein